MVDCGAEMVPTGFQARLTKWVRAWARAPRPVGSVTSATIRWVTSGPSTSDGDEELTGKEVRKGWSSANFALL